jgi:hypothetical protein
MKVTIRVEITTDWDETETFEICQLERPYRQLEPDKAGLSLAEGKDLLHSLQKIIVAAQAEEVCTLRRFCTPRTQGSADPQGGYGLRYRVLSQCPDRLLSMRDAVADGVSVQSDDRIRSGAGDHGTTVA